jgi:uncharacterized repeat protein (TIGR01451 family)
MLWRVMIVRYWLSHRVALLCTSVVLAVTIAAAGEAVGAPTLTKAFNPTTIAPGGTTTLTFTLTNPPNNAAQAVSFTDIFPSKLRGAPTLNFTSTCTVDSLIYLLGPAPPPPAPSNVLGFAIGVTVPASGAAAATCAISLDVTNVPLQTGTCPDPNLTNGPSNISNTVNLVNAVTSNCVTVTPTGLPPTLTKAFNPTTIAPGGTTTLTFTLTNPPNNAAQAVSFTDMFPSKLRGAPTLNFTSTCTVDSLIYLLGPAPPPPAPSNVLGFAIGVTVPASGAAAATCAISLDVTNVPLQTGTCPDPNLTNGPSNISNTVNLVNAVTSNCVDVSVPNIPTVSERALLLLILLLGVAGATYARRH